MAAVIPGLWASTPDALSFDRSLAIRSFLRVGRDSMAAYASLARSSGNVWRSWGAVPRLDRRRGPCGSS
jgi:hypothetical protein